MYYRIHRAKTCHPFGIQINGAGRALPYRDATEFEKHMPGLKDLMSTNEENDSEQRENVINHRSTVSLKLQLLTSRIGDNV